MNFVKRSEKILRKSVLLLLVMAAPGLALAGRQDTKKTSVPAPSKPAAAARATTPTQKSAPSRTTAPGQTTSAHPPATHGPVPGTKPGPGQKPSATTQQGGRKRPVDNNQGKKGGGSSGPPVDNNQGKKGGGGSPVGNNNAKGGGGTFKPPVGAKQTKNPDGSSTYKARNGDEFGTDKNGHLSSYSHGDTKASFRPDGHVSSIHTGAMDINRGVHGGRTVETRFADGRRVVGYGGRRGGYVEHPFKGRDGRLFVRRTYWGPHGTYARVYGSYHWQGADYRYYVHPFFYAPAFYGWAYRPWGRVSWGLGAWGWGVAPWWGFYSGYFTPYGYYNSPAYWLTDYLLAANLQAAYADAAGSETAEDTGLAFVPIFADGTKALGPGFSAAGNFISTNDRIYLQGGATANFSFSVP